jgi:hypothetical protein
MSERYYTPKEYETAFHESWGDMDAVYFLDCTDTPIGETSQRFWNVGALGEVKDFIEDINGGEVLCATTRCPRSGYVHKTDGRQGTGRIKDCGTCDHGLLKSPKMVFCTKGWPTQYHRRSFGETCFYWKERQDGKKYYDYDFDEPHPLVWAIEDLIEDIDRAVESSKHCGDEDIREHYERNMVSFRSSILKLKDRGGPIYGPNC